MWLCSIKVIGQRALLMSFGWADSASSSSPWRLGDQMLVAQTITSQSITELGDRDNSGGGGYIRAKHAQIWTEDTKKPSVCNVFLASFWDYHIWLWNIFGLIKIEPDKTDVSKLWHGDWSALMVVQIELTLPVPSLTEAEELKLCDAQLWQQTHTLWEVRHCGGCMKTHIQDTCIQANVQTDT